MTLLSAKFRLTTLRISSLHNTRFIILTLSLQVFHNACITQKDIENEKATAMDQHLFNHT